MKKYRKLLGFAVITVVSFCAVTLMHTGKTEAFAFDDATALTVLKNACNPSASTKTTHIAYADNISQTDASITFTLKARSYTCGSQNATNVSNTLTTFSPSGVAVPHMFYSNTTLAPSTASGVYSYGPFTYNNLPLGATTFSYSYRVTSFNTSATGTSSFTVTLIDECNNIPGLQKPVPSGYTRDAAGNCYTPRAVSCVGNVGFDQVNVGAPGTLNHTIINNTPLTGNYAAITINSTTYSGPSLTTSGNVSYSSNPVGWQGGVSTIKKQATFTTAGTHTVTATISYTYGSTSGLTLSCTGTVTVTTPPSLVSCVGNVTFNEIEYGVQGTLDTRIVNNSPAWGAPNIRIDSVAYASVPSGMVLIGGNNYSSNPVARQGGQSVITQSAQFPEVNDYVVTAIVTYIDSGTSRTLTCNGTVKTSALPYMKVYGGDVIAGGGFGSGACTSTTGTILALGRTGGFRGSSAQFGVTALKNIKGFYSASQRTAAPIAAKGLTFSNTVGDPTYGGAFSNAGVCIPNYYDSTQEPLLPAKAPLTGAFSRGLSRYVLPANTTITSMTIPKGSQVAVYVNGNAYINGNVLFDASARTSRTDIPYFSLIAKGNIYIAPNVSRLDGVYIAQPNNFLAPTNGRIYTCAPGFGIYSAAQLATACDDSPLAVNGALVAQQVRFLRTLNTLKESTSREVPNFSDGSRTSANTKAAEVINYSPEIYLAPSPLKNPNSTTSAGGIRSPEAIFDLPPVF